MCIFILGGRETFWILFSDVSSCQSRSHLHYSCLSFFVFKVAWFGNNMKLKVDAFFFFLLCLKTQISLSPQTAALSSCYLYLARICLRAEFHYLFLYTAQVLSNTRIYHEERNVLLVLWFSIWQWFYLLINLDWCSKCKLTVQCANDFLLYQTSGHINSNTAGH